MQENLGLPLSAVLMKMTLFPNLFWEFPYKPVHKKADALLKYYM